MEERKIIDSCPQCGGYLVGEGIDYNDDTKIVKFFMRCAACNYKLEQEVKTTQKPLRFSISGEELLCPRCGETAQFDMEKVGENLIKILEGEQRQLKVEVQCLKCGCKFAVNLCMDY